jgi:hypothetical protein
MCSPLNNRSHSVVDGIANDEGLENLEKLKVYAIQFNSEEGLAKQIAGLANLSMVLGYRLEDENRVLTKEEAYEQFGHSASVLRALL